MQQEARRLRVAAAMENLVLWRLEDATRTKEAICRATNIQDVIYICN